MKKVGSNISKCIILYYVMLCYVMLCYIISYYKLHVSNHDIDQIKLLFSYKTIIVVWAKLDTLKNNQEWKWGRKININKSLNRYIYIYSNIYIIINTSLMLLVRSSVMGKVRLDQVIQWWTMPRMLLWLWKNESRHHQHQRLGTFVNRGYTLLLPPGLH